MVAKIFRPIMCRCIAVVALLAIPLGLAPIGQAEAQLRIEITEGQVAPTPIAIAEFTGLDGNVPAVGRQLTQIISDDLQINSVLLLPVLDLNLLKNQKQTHS